MSFLTILKPNKNCFFRKDGNGAMRKKYSAFLVCFLFLLLLILTSGCSNDETKAKSNVIKIAALLPISGELTSKGEVRKLAIERGVEDSNKNWKTEGKDLEFDLIVEDSQSDPEVALIKAEQLWEEGYEIFIAGSSAEIEKLQPWAADCGAIVISYSSTSPTLGSEDDGVFRMVPDDTQQAKALSSLLEYEGIFGIVPVYRDDVYGRELTKLLIEEFTLLNGTISEPVIYQTQETDWDNVVGQASAAIDSLDMEKERIAIVLVSFDEAADILGHSGGVKNMNEVRWFGTDTVTLSPVILDEKEIAQKASEVNVTGVTFGVPESALLHSIQPELESFTEGNFLPDALFAYDIPGMLASVIDQLDRPFSTEKLMGQMISGSETYAGVTGWTLLNKKGDRKYYHYDVWEVLAEGDDTYAWKKTAKYLNAPGVPGYIAPYISTDLGSDQSESFLFGYEGQELNLERALTRAEFTYMLMNATNHTSPEETKEKSTFNDEKDIDPRAKSAVAFAQKYGIIEESDNTFRPNQEITWLEAIAMIVREKQWKLESSITHKQLDGNISEKDRSYITTAIENELITITEEEFVQFMNDSVLLEDAMLLIIEIMKGEEIYE